MTDGRKRGLGCEDADLGLGIRPKYIGARVKRVEDRRLLTGEGIFTDDRIVPGALHVAFRRSDHPHALISSINTAATEAMPGVVGVYTARELNGLVEPVYATSRMQDYHSTALYPLAREKVRYVGEPVVAVLAESRCLAEDALDRIEIAYEPLETVIDPERAVSEDAALLHEEAGTNILATREFARGDLADGDGVGRWCGSAAVSDFAARRRSPSSPAPVSRNTIAGGALLTLTVSTQIPGILRDVLADLLKMPGHSVRVIAPDVGGGFGGKASLYPEEIIVSVLARHLGRAVRWSGNRQEDFVSTTHGFDEIVEAELGLDRDGHILALAAEIIGDVGAYSIYPWTAALEPVQVVEFHAGALPHSDISRACTGGRNLQDPDRPLSRRRPADLDLCHGAADRHGSAAARHRSRSTAPAQPDPSRRVPLPGGLRHRLGPFRLCRQPDKCVPGNRLRPAARGTGKSTSRRTACWDRHRHLRGADRHRLSHFGSTGHADQHRHGNRHDPP